MKLVTCPNHAPSILSCRGAPGASLVDAIDQAVARSDLEELEAVANILHKALIPLRKRAKADAAFEAGTPVVVIRVRPQRAR